MQKRTLIVVGAVAAAVVAVAAIVCADPDLRSQALLTVAPAKFREGALSRFSGTSGEQVYVQGTIGGRHLSHGDYSLAHLRALILRLKPDVVLVEASPEALARDDLSDGPLEAGYAALAAREAGSYVLGYGLRPDEAGEIGGDEARTDALFANAAGALAGHRKVLVLVDVAVAPGFADRLRTLGFSRAGFAASDKAAMFDLTGVDRAYPAGLAAHAQRRLAADRRALKAATDREARGRLQDDISGRLALLKAIGRADGA